MGNAAESDRVTVSDRSTIIRSKHQPPLSGRKCRPLIPVRLEVVSAQRTPAGYYYAANNFSAAEHGGTHLDAPVHFAQGRHTTDQIPLSQLIGPAVVVDLRAEVERTGADYRVPVAALEAWERVHGAVPQGAIVLLLTGCPGTGVGSGW